MITKFNDIWQVRILIEPWIQDIYLSMSCISKSSGDGSRTSIGYLRKGNIVFLQYLYRPDFGKNNKAHTRNFKSCFHTLLSHVRKKYGKSIRFDLTTICFETFSCLSSIIQDSSYIKIFRISVDFNFTKSS